MPYKDTKAVCADLKKIYAAVNLDDAEYAKEEFREKWDRKFTKTKAIFPTDDSIRKAIYLTAKEISEKWTMPVRDWRLAYAQFTIFFEDRFAV